MIIQEVTTTRYISANVVLKRRKMTTTAEDLFRSFNEYMKNEKIVMNTISDVFGTDWKDFSYDAVENSLEVFGVSENFKYTVKARNLIRKLGFKALYIHNHKRYNGYEGCKCELKDL